MDVIQFRIRHPDGRVDELATEAKCILIGSGSHCEIRLPVGAARVEHAFLQSTPAGWRVTARSFDPAPRLDGSEFSEAPVVGPCVLSIDAIRIEIAPSSAVAPNQGGLRAGGRGGSRVYAYLLVGIAASIGIVASHVKSRSPAAEPQNVPALWASTVESCPQADPEQATFAAESRLALAVAKAERSPFHPEDGVAAVTSYESAAACFRVGGRDDDAVEATENAMRLRRDVTEQFRVHRLRLQRALADEDWVFAEREAGALLSFFAPAGGGEYGTWLANLRRRLQLQYGSKREKRT